jgi:hypothetical protein
LRGGFLVRHTCAVQLPARLETLVLRSGLHPGLLSEPDRALVLAFASCALEPHRALREDEVNGRLVDWLADLGAMLRTDHVELRRWLVDTGFVARDDWGRAYVRGASELERTRQILGSTDAVALAAAVRALRVAAQHARLARRRAFHSARP